MQCSTLQVSDSIPIVVEIRAQSHAPQQQQCMEVGTKVDTQLTLGRVVGHQCRHSTTPSPHSHTTQQNGNDAIGDACHTPSSGACERSKGCVVTEDRSFFSGGCALPEAADSQDALRRQFCVDLHKTSSSSCCRVRLRLGTRLGREFNQVSLITRNFCIYCRSLQAQPTAVESLLFRQLDKHWCS